MRADDHRLAERARLDQVLAAVLEEAPSHEDHVGGGVVGEHLAHGIAHHHAYRRIDGAGIAATRHAQPALERKPRHLVEALRVPRHDHQQRTGLERARGKRVEEQRLLALARASRDPHRTVLAEARAELAPALERLGRHGEVELHVADHTHAARAEALEALRVGGCLGGDSREVRKRPSRECRHARVTACGALREPRVGEHHGHAKGGALLEQPRPQLGLEDDAELGAEMAQEPAHREALVVGQPGALHAVAEELDAGVAPRGRHVRDEDAMARMAAPERVDDGRRGARLADGNRVDPNARRLRRRVVMPEAFADAQGIAALAARAQPQPRDHHGCGKQPQGRVGEARHAGSIGADSALSP